MGAADEDEFSSLNNVHEYEIEEHELKEENASKANMHIVSDLW